MKAREMLEFLKSKAKICDIPWLHSIKDQKGGSKEEENPVKLIETKISQQKQKRPHDPTKKRKNDDYNTTKKQKK